MSSWTEKLPGGKGWRGRYRDQAGRKQTVRDDQGKPVAFTRKTDAKWAADNAKIKAHRQAPSSITRADITWGQWWDQLKITRHTDAQSDRPPVENSIARKHLLPQWGERPLNEITRRDVQQWVNDISKTQSAGYVTNHIYALFRTTLSEAVHAEVLVATPCTKIKLPKHYQPTRKPYLKPEHVYSGFVTQLRPDYRALIEFMYETGLRPGEACGLHAHQVHEKWIMVSEVLVDRRYAIRSLPKNRKPRAVPLTNRAREILADVLADRDLIRWCGVPHLDEKPCESDLVFRRRDGRPFRSSSVSAYLRRLQKRTGVPTVSPYAARRGFVTWAIEGGTDILTVQRITGHASLDELQGYFQLSGAAVERLQRAHNDAGATGAPAGADFDRQMSEDADRSRDQDAS